MTTSKNYILITLSDFPRNPLFGRKPEMRFRSVEKYLEHNLIPFESQGDSIYIFVRDEFEARQVGEHFRIKTLRYLLDSEWVTLSLEKQKPKRQPRKKKMNVEYPGEITSIKELKQVMHRQKTEDAIAFTLLTKRRILTQAELKQGVKDGVFHPFVSGGKKYIPNTEIQSFLKM